MDSSPQRLDANGLPSEMLREVNSLLSQICDDLADSEAIARLGALMLQNSAVRDHYLRYIALHSALATSAGSCQSPERIEELPPALAIFDGDGQEIQKDREAELVCQQRWPNRRRIWPVAAAVLLSLGALIWGLSARRFAESQHLPQRSIARSNGGARPLAARPLVAEITSVSRALRWRLSNEAYALTSQVRAGQTLSLTSGAVELTYDSGTTLTLTGPSEFVVDANGGTLERGEIVAHVTEQGHGFTILTPHGKIIDRGTEFGVVVDDFGVSEVNVFKGRVEAFPVVDSGAPAPKIDLTTGRSLQWSGESIITVNAAHRTLRPSVIAARADGQPQLIPTVLLDVPSGGAGFDPGRWKTLGEVHPAPNGLRLDGRSSPAERPYLITARDHDPSEGAIVITCDVRFDPVQGGVQPEFSILTRAADDRSKPAATWHDMLSSCVRASLKADMSSGEGMLEAGAKYEFDREPSTISWRGFARPQAGVTYHLLMRDDGLNVSFTASEAGNPTVSKTVTCRSLFRGRQNFIAFEGFRGGAAMVSNICITQVESRLTDIAVRESAKEASRSDEPTPDAALGEVFANDIPAGAMLRFADSFDNQALDEVRWMTLGETSVAGGAVHLGVANAEQHIDTWRPRPYLLTRERFTPAQAPVIVTGRASFASNFLHGYGGSFAVLTRAEAKYGESTGWEQSALRRGLRANFWPAALGQNRSLELFEMLSPEPLNLLATTDFPVDPQSRTYYFCIKDDGKIASLSLVDAENTRLRKTLAQPTQSPLLSSGHIAFEGCWGAPVQLDDVHVYECPKPQEAIGANR
jgi:hypothetical protein